MWRLAGASRPQATRVGTMEHGCSNSWRGLNTQSLDVNLQIILQQVETTKRISSISMYLGNAGEG